MPDMLNMYYFITAFIEKYCQIINKYYLIDYLEQDHGTGGWQTAFEYACNESANEKLIEYCDKLQWDEYDKFSREINDIVIEWIKENPINH